MLKIKLINKGMRLVLLWCAAVTVAPLAHSEVIIDTDLDGLGDAWESFYGFDPLVTNNSGQDPDADGLTNLQEFQHSLNPVVSNAANDSDGDVVTDVNEVTVYSTHPVNPDSDGDGMKDGWELQYSLNPLDRNDAYGDIDGDDLLNVQEFFVNANPLLVDTDGDSVLDDTDDLPANPLATVDTDNDGVGNNQDTDDDGDGITDSVESSQCVYGIWPISCTNPLKKDTDSDTLDDLTEIQNNTNPVGHLPFLIFWIQGDLDSDGMPDDWEALHGLSSATADAEGDGLNNLEEFTYITDPNSNDSDGDGFQDEAELLAGADPASAADTLQVIMATGQSLAVGSLGSDDLDPSDPEAEFVVTTLPALSDCSFGFCLMLNTGSRGVGSDVVNTPDFPLAHFDNMYEGSDTLGPYSCQVEERQNKCTPRETQGPGMLKQLHVLQEENAPVFLYRSHGSPGQLYDPTRNPAYDPLADLENIHGLKKGSRAYRNAFGPVDYEGTTLDGELDSIIQMAADPLLSPWPAQGVMQPRAVQVAALTITHGERDIVVNNQEYDDDLREWIADYSEEILAKTQQSSAPIVLIDQIKTKLGEQGHKVQLDMLEVADQLGNVYLSTPKYHLPYRGVDNVHLTAEGYHLLGEYQAKVLDRVRKGEDWKPLQPESVTLAGNIFDITFHIPDGDELVLDTAACDRVEGTAGHYDDLHGFQYREGFTGEVISTIKINSVVIINNVVRVTLDGTPNMVNFPHITYAYDAIYGQNCGALRDNDPAQATSSLPAGSENEGLLLHNWAVVFNQQPDNDGDGLPDGWELQYGLNPGNAADAVMDSDNDGLTNLEEYQQGTLPNNVDTDGDALSDNYEVDTSFTLPARADTDGDELNDGAEVNIHFTDPLDPDTDGDGIPDGWEQQYALNPLSALDAVEDTDDDGYKNLREYLNQTDPTLAARPYDFDADGDADILFREASSGSNIIWKMENGAKQANSLLTSNATTFEVAAVVDVDGDYDADIIWSDPVEGKLITWIIQDAVKQSNIFLGNTTYTLFDVGDFDGDGDPDLLHVTAANELLIWRLVNGDRDTNVTLGVPDAGYTLVGTGDLDGDGDKDILFRNASGSVQAWFLEDANRQSSAVLGSMTTNYLFAGTEDFDKDGDEDILWRNHNAGISYLWTIQNHALASSVNLGTNAGFSLEEINDFDYDRDADILFRNNADGKTVVWLIENGTKTNSYLGQNGINYGLVTAKDFDNDSDADIYFRSSTGQNIIWIMENGIKLSNSVLPTNAASYEPQF